MSFDLEDIIENWKIEHGTRTPSKKYGVYYYKIPLTEREELFKILVRTIKASGRDREFFKLHSTQNAIATACFPPIIYDKDSRERGYNALKSQLKSVVAEVWKEDEGGTTPEEKAKKAQEANDCSYTGPLKELDRAIFEDAPKPTTGVDEEAEKLLGFKR